MNGKLIIIEGTDGSGKATQAEKLFERLSRESVKIKKVEFPNYQSDSSALVKMYLNGDFGKNPNDVSPYVASTFYAVDRYASFKKEWEAFYREGGIVLSDRYTTSNMIHQASKIEDISERKKFLDWLWNFEFEMYKLPVPDLVFFLDMPPEHSRKLRENRKNKINGEAQKDIHESDEAYLESVYKASCEIAEEYHWHRIGCESSGKIRSIEEIHEEIYEAVKKYL